MCGDLDEDDSASDLEERLYARFLAHARSLLPKAEQPSQAAPADISAYMEALFCEALGRSLRDGEQATEAERYQRLAMQPVVFARLAGFLAGHLSLGEDPLRKVMEALMLGYGEAEAMDRVQESRQDHHHGDVYVNASRP
jgi:hypothetical protein